MVVILCFILLCIFLLFMYFHHRITIEPFTFLDYNQLLANHSDQLFKPSFASNIQPEEEDCYEMCDSKQCLNMQERNKILNSCVKCRSENKCFHKSIIGGNCDDCMEDEVPIDCYDTRHFGCTNPRDFNSYNGVFSYFVMSNSDDVNSLYNKECLFCWDIQNQL